MVILYKMINLIKFNRHWNKGFRYDYPKTRKWMNVLRQHLDDRMIIELTGLRRLGKTTLFLQLINELINKGTDPLNIWYYSFDEERYVVDEIFVEFQKQSKKDLQKDKIYVFFDEIIFRQHQFASCLRFDGIASWKMHMLKILAEKYVASFFINVYHLFG